ncbi:small kinetochore-associated protein isoform X1 [Gadus morhua]|nr:uncharacterized protein LOC115534472 isoform X1 [Gadus morhua]
MSSKNPKAAHPTLEMKEGGNLKPQKENAQRKNAPKVFKGASTRYGQQEELKDQNQLLLVSNEQLQNSLTESQQKVTELGLQFKDLEKENADIQKRLNDCHVLLVAGKIDPVSGDAIAQPSKNQGKEVLNISRDLIKELGNFTDIGTKQLEQLKVFQTAIADLHGEGEHVMQEREDFSLQVLEMEKALEEAEQLLIE